MAIFCSANVALAVVCIISITFAKSVRGIAIKDLLHPLDTVAVVDAVNQNDDDRLSGDTNYIRNDIPKVIFNEIPKVISNEIPKVILSDIPNGNDILKGIPEYLVDAMDSEIDWHIACRSCKELVMSGRYAVLVEKGAIVDFFADKCYDFFSDHDEKNNCHLVIQIKVNKTIESILSDLAPMKICKHYLHLCPAKRGISEN